MNKRTRPTNSRVVTYKEVDYSRNTGKQQRRAKRPQMGMQTQVPFAQAVNIRQSAPNRITTLTGKEQFASFTVSSALSPGKVQLFDINPAELEGTRLTQVCSNFQEYRVRKLAVTLVTNLPTTAGGSIVIGSTSNPDQLIETSSQVFALNGAQIASMYVPVVVNCNFTKTWLKIDPDSDDRMLTTASRVAIALQSSASITGTATCPLLLDWVIEFRGSAIQNINFNRRTFVMPATTCTSVDSTYAVYLAPQSGESLPLPAIANDWGYEITGGFNVTDTNSEERTVRILRKGPSSGGQAYYFFSDEEDYQNSLPIKVQFLADLKFNRFILEALN